MSYLPADPVITSIIVTYHPNLDDLSPLLNTLLDQTQRVVLVDNTPGDKNKPLEAVISNSIAPGRCEIIRFGENLGIAKALNEGCDKAISLGTDFVLLSDQDSLPATDMVSRLLDVFRSSRWSFDKIGAVGPTYTDMHTGVTYPFQQQKPRKLFYSHVTPTEDDPYVETLSLITSGTLIPTSALSKVGPMREDLFIDYVDIDWGMRARHRGFTLIGSGAARMFQRMGEDSVRVWYFGWRNESLYSPLRLYYRTRNFVALLKDNKIDWRWKIRSSWYSLGLLYTHSLFSLQRYQSIRHFFIGVRDGVTSRMGKYDS